MRAQRYAVKAGTATSTNDEAGSTARATGPKDQLTQAPIIGQHTVNHQQILTGPKRLATLKAHFAMRGFELNPLDGESMLIARWGLHRVLPNLAAAEAFLAQIGGPRG